MGEKRSYEVFNGNHIDYVNIFPNRMSADKPIDAIPKQVGRGN
jgi:hypothetical protein